MKRRGEFVSSLHITKYKRETRVTPSSLHHSKKVLLLLVGDRVAAIMLLHGAAGREVEEREAQQRWNPAPPNGVGRRINIDTTAGEQMVLRAHRHNAKPAAEHCMPSWPQTPDKLNPISAWATGKAEAGSPPRARLDPSHRSYGLLVQLWEVGESSSRIGQGQLSRFTARPDESLRSEFGSVLSPEMARYHASAAHRSTRQTRASQPVSTVSAHCKNYAQQSARARVAAMSTRHGSAPNTLSTGPKKEVGTIREQLQTARAERAAERAADTARAAVAVAVARGDVRGGGERNSSLHRSGEKSELEELRKMGVGNATSRSEKVGYTARAFI